jgi:hypothetical protein
VLDHPRARRIVQNFFALHFHRIMSTAAKIIALLGAIFTRTRRRRRTLDVARSPYFIDVFATCAACANNFAQRSFDAMSCARCASLRARIVRSARRIHTSLSGVSVFFIAL